MGRRTDAMRTLAAAVAGGLLTGLVLAAAGALAGVGPVAADADRGDEVRAVYRSASPAVVSVAASDRTGSGFLVDDGGHVVTNAHVIGDDRSVEVSIGGRRVGATVRGVEPSVDVAVLTLDAPAGDIAPLRFAEDDDVRVGDPVVAIGAPFGLQGSLSTGIVSGLRRQIDSPNGFAITGVIQTDAALNPGNSGGPLLDLSGRVVGVATQIATEGGRNEGIGFAVPAPVVRRTALRIIATGDARLPYLGIVGQDVGDGVLLADVLPSGPAVGALRPEDVIVAIDGRPAASNAALASALAERIPGETVTVGVIRAGQEVDVPVKLSARPSGGP
jgi:putative serine protease PepD